MNSRERVDLALNHKEPDRVPLDLWGTDSRLINDFYFKVLEHLGLEPPETKVRPGKSAEYVDYRIADMVSSDFRHIVIGRPENFKPYYNEKGVRFDEWGIGHVMKGSYNFICYYPLADADISDIKKFKGLNIYDPGRIKGLKEQAEDWYNNTDYAITTTGPISGFIKEYYEYLRGTENFFTDMYLNQELARHLYDRLADIFTEFYLYFISTTTPYLTWIEFESDFGMQDRPLISRELFVKFLKDPMQRVITEVKKAAPNAKIYLHSCGSIKEFMPDFIDMGIDIISSIQPLAKDMDSELLKKEFGNDIVFHGGVDIQRALCGSLEDIITESKKRIYELGQGGGYIFGPANHIQVDVPVENFFAMYETAKKYGVYPLKDYRQK